MRIIQQFLADETGATAIEYTMILALIAMAIVGSVGNLRDSVINMYTFIGDLFQASTNPGG